MRIELVAHMDAGDRRQWIRGQDERPLSELGWRQATRLCDELVREPIDGLYASRALRARQSIEPLARRLGLSIAVLPGLQETDAWAPPPRWRTGNPFGDAPALGGAYAAGLAMTAVAVMRADYPNGRVVACTHGDVLPALVAYLIGAHDLDVPAPNETRGGWYTLVFERQRVEVRHHDVLRDFPL